MWGPDLVASVGLEAQILCWIAAQLARNSIDSHFEQFWPGMTNSANLGLADVSWHYSAQRHTQSSSKFAVQKRHMFKLEERSIAALLLGDQCVEDRNALPPTTPTALVSVSVCFPLGNCTRRASILDFQTKGLEWNSSSNRETTIAWSLHQARNINALVWLGDMSMEFMCMHAHVNIQLAFAAIIIWTTNIITNCTGQDNRKPLIILAWPQPIWQFFKIVGSIWVEFWGVRLILRLPVIWVGFLSRIGIEIIPKYGLEVDFYLRTRQFARKPFLIINIPVKMNY